MTALRYKPGRLFGVVLSLGIAARMLVALRGQDYDMDSWQLVARLFDNGANIYAATSRYNYGPIWFYILHLLDLLAGHNPAVLRYLISGLLSLGDAGIFFILWRQFGPRAACWFFLNPISIIVSGYQCNFDNLAILLGLIAVLMMENDFDRPIDRRKFLGLAILGLALVLKHVLFAFPFWLAVKQRGIKQKLLVLSVPILIFLLSFVPYLPSGGHGIIQNVFLYRSHPTDIFFRMFLPQFVQQAYSSQTLWLLLLILFAFIYRQKSAVELLLFYTCVLVVAAPVTLNEYLAIPLVFTVTHLNPLTILYMVVGSLHLLMDHEGLHLFDLNWKFLLPWAIYLLCLAWIWETWRQKISGWFKRFKNWCITEIKNQLEIPN
jgi:hypothetical protein